MAGGEALLMFGDSSGNPSMARGGFVDSRHFIAGTITMDAGEAHRVDEAILGIKRRYFSRADPVRIEFHGSALRKKLNLHTGNRARAEKMFYSIFNELVDVTSDSGALVNMVIMDKVAPVETSGHVGVISRTWGHAADLFRQNLFRSERETVGISILDRYDDATNRVVSKAIAQSLEQIGSFAQKAIGAIPHPILVDSRSSNIIQLIDIITYIVASNVNESNGTEFTKMYRRLLPSIGRIINLKPKLA